MAQNPYIDYYRRQSGTGISSFQGVRWQRGHSFFGRLLRRAAIPILKFLGREALGAGAQVAQDVIAGGNIKDSAKKHFIARGKKIAEKGISKLEEMGIPVQNGSGRRRRKVKRRTTGSKKKAPAKRTSKKRKQTGGGVNIRTAKKYIVLRKVTQKRSLKKVARKKKTAPKRKKNLIFSL